MPSLTFPPCSGGGQQAALMKDQRDTVVAQYLEGTQRMSHVYDKREFQTATHSSIALLLPQFSPQSEELFVLPRDKVNCCVLQQSSKDKQQAHCHPDVNGLHIGHLYASTYSLYVIL